jgi:hypothetical protein
MSVQPCVRPVSAAHRAAGHNALRADAGVIVVGPVAARDRAAAELPAEFGLFCR